MFGPGALTPCNLGCVRGLSRGTPEADSRRRQDRAGRGAGVRGMPPLSLMSTTPRFVTSAKRRNAADRNGLCVRVTWRSRNPSSRDLLGFSVALPLGADHNYAWSPRPWHGQHRRARRGLNVTFPRRSAPTGRANPKRQGSRCLIKIRALHSQQPGRRPQCDLADGGLCAAVTRWDYCTFSFPVLPSPDTAGQGPTAAQ